MSKAYSPAHHIDALSRYAEAKAPLLAEVDSSTLQMELKAFNLIDLGFVVGRTRQERKASMLHLAHSVMAASTNNDERRAKFEDQGEQFDEATKPFYDAYATAWLPDVPALTLDEVTDANISINPFAQNAVARIDGGYTDRETAIQDAASTLTVIRHHLLVTSRMPSEPLD